VPVAWRLHGPLNVSALDQAVAELVARHESLRSRFPVVDEDPIAVLEQRGPVLSYVSEAGLSNALDRAMGSVLRLAWQPFDLSEGPLFRAQLTNIAENDHILVLVFHHIIVDGFSIDIIQRELSILYDAYLQARRPSLPLAALRYVDFASWQQSEEAGVSYRRDVAYWKDRLGESPPILDLPTDRPRQREQRFAGARLRHTFDGSAAPLLEFCRKRGVTSFTTIMAVFGMFLSRYTGQDDLIVGFPAAGRARDEFKSVVGCFVNTLPLRFELAGVLSFDDVVSQARTRIAEALDHQNVPFDQLVREINPIVEVMLSFAGGAPPLVLSNLNVTDVELDTPHAKFDLSISFRTVGDALVCALDFDSDLFEADTALRMLANFGTFLSAGLKAPETDFRRLPLIGSSELERISEWERPVIAPVRAETLPDWFERTVRQHGELTAIVDGRDYSYKELDAAADRVAAAVRPLLQDTRRVGLCLSSSFEAVAAILGIMKAGGTYLPLDPAYPRARIATMVQDALPDVIVTRLTLAHVLPDGQSVVDIDEALCKPAVPHESGSDPSDAAYILYTSGSTGQPNGVVVEHRSVVAYISAFQRFVSMSAHDRIVQVSSLAFDASIEEIFGTLTCGAALLIPPVGTVSNVRAFLSFCDKHGTTVLDTPTAYFHEIAGALRTLPDLAFPQTVRLAITGGEALSPARVEDFFSHARKDVRLLNGYGPTEATIVSTLFEVERNQLDEFSAVPIGRPIENVSCSIRDSVGERSPIGVIGELYVGGVGLARGYHERPQLTADRFVDGGRYYRTGDMVRYRPDGVIEYRGRADGQRKIRGFRVETDEVAAVLASHPHVTQAAVVVDGDALVACVILSPSDVTEGQLHAYLSERLPTYAVPSRIAIVDAIPFTPVGKLDRVAIVEQTRVNRNEAPVNPDLNSATLFELQLATIWEDVLHRPVEPHDDFFDLGGHSLAAARIMTRVEAETGVRLSLNVLFERPTISLLEEALYDDWSARATLDVVHERQRPGAPIFFIHASLHGGLYTRSLARKIKVNRPLCVLELHGANGREIPPTVEEMAEDYVDRIRAVQPHGPYVLAGYCQGAVLIFEVAHQLRASGEDVSNVIAIEPSRSPFVMAGMLNAVDKLRRAIRLPSEYSTNVSFAAKRIWRIAKRLSDPNRRGPALKKLVLQALKSQSYEKSARGRREAAEDSIYHICNAHNPRWFDGSLTIITAAGQPLKAGDTRFWRKFARRVRFEETPGGHSSALTHHLPELAALISEIAGNDDGVISPAAPKLTG